MSNEIYGKIIQIADDISDKLIYVNAKNQSENKTLLQLYHELLDSQYKEYELVILSYLPERLAIKGYEIVNQKYFELKKY